MQSSGLNTNVPGMRKSRLGRRVRGRSIGGTVHCSHPAFISPNLHNAITIKHEVSGKADFCISKIKSEKCWLNTPSPEIQSCFLSRLTQRKLWGLDTKVVKLHHFSGCFSSFCTFGRGCTLQAPCYSLRWGWPDLKSKFTVVPLCARYASLSADGRASCAAMRTILFLTLLVIFDRRINENTF